MSRRVDCDRRSETSCAKRINVETRELAEHVRETVVRMTLALERRYRKHSALVRENVVAMHRMWSATSAGSGSFTMRLHSPSDGRKLPFTFVPGPKTASSDAATGRTVACDSCPLQHGVAFIDFGGFALLSGYRLRTGVTSFQHAAANTQDNRKNLFNPGFHFSANKFTSWRQPFASCMI
jgi:hypothetical protein